MPDHEEKRRAAQVPHNPSYRVRGGGERPLAFIMRIHTPGDFGEARVIAKGT